MKRNLFIDVVKGIATLSVIFIHTVFWSGERYVPSEIRSLSLLIDVPIFFFLSGFTSSGNIERNIHRLLKLQITYMVFITLIYFYCNFYNKDLNWIILLNWYLHDYSFSGPLEVVMGSMWYLKIYFITSFFGTIVLKYCSQKQISILIGIFIICLFYFSFHFYPQGNTGYILTYLSFFLIAHQLKNINLKPLYAILCFLLLLFIYYLLYLYFGNKATLLIRYQKFPPNIIYFVYSSFSLLIIVFLKGRIKFSKNNFLSYIGQNAIFYYFAQGIICSKIYALVKLWENFIDWPILLLLIFSINVILATIMAYILKKIDYLGWKFLYFIKNKTM